MQPGHQRRPRRAAEGTVVELREPDAFRRQPIQVRRLNLAAVAAEIGKAHVVGQDDDDVRAVGGTAIRDDARQQQDHRDPAGNGENNRLHGWATVRRWSRVPKKTENTALRPAATRACRAVRISVPVAATANQMPRRAFPPHLIARARPAEAAQGIQGIKPATGTGHAPGSGVRKLTSFRERCLSRFPASRRQPAGRPLCGEAGRGQTTLPFHLPAPVFLPAFCHRIGPRKLAGKLGQEHQFVSGLDGRVAIGRYSNKLSPLSSRLRRVANRLRQERCIAPRRTRKRC